MKITERMFQKRFFEDIFHFNKRNKEFDWFQEVGNHDSFFRVDITSYGKNNFEGYELKLKSCKELIKQLEKHFYSKRFTRIYAVLPNGEAEKFKELLGKHLEDSVYILSYNYETYDIKIVKKGKEIKQDVYKKIELLDLIVRGYHLEGKFKRQHYK
ncbi:hypothetical protein [Cetobacterium sp.]|uniref:hypothetical protein n=1 Tax=Cetobacterium sp. TaxID=2071632 RepID=UPI003F376D97